MVYINPDQRETEAIPGTEVLLYHDVSEHLEDSDKLCLVPEPSNDPHDPLVSVLLNAIHILS